MFSNQRLCRILLCLKLKLCAKEMFWSWKLRDPFDYFICSINICYAILGCLVHIPGIGCVLGVPVATASTIAYATNGELHIWLVLCTLAFLPVLLNSRYSGLSAIA